MAHSVGVAAVPQRYPGGAAPAGGYQHARLIWTVAPVMERVEFDIEFTDVQLTEGTSP